VIAVVVVRRGSLPIGAEEAVDEAGGRVLLVGSDTGTAADALSGAVTDIRRWEAGPFRAGAWATTLAPELMDDPVILLPASADGRDLAPRLAAALGRPLLAPAIRVTERAVTLVRAGGLALIDVAVDEPIVATLQPGCRGTGARLLPPAPSRTLSPTLTPGHDAEPVDLVEADAATIDLTEAKRIMAGGAGLGSPAVMALLERVATALGCATGATRVVADAGWVPFSRQIGTTGAVVDPDLYVAFGISGAVQHVSGLGSPRDVVAINTDPSCPMMQFADLAIVADGPGVLEALSQRLGIDSNQRSSPVPSGAVPSGAVPSGAVPSGAVPSGAVPSGAVPSGAEDQ
jgi:electron transfer flavoprotein alpha subunit